MKISNDHILTTHTGSLPRPEQLVDLVYAKQEGKKVDGDTFEFSCGQDSRRDSSPAGRTRRRMWCRTVKSAKPALSTHQ